MTSVQYRVDMIGGGIVGEYCYLSNRTAKPLSYLGRVRCAVLKMVRLAAELKEAVASFQTTGGFA